MSHDDVNEWKYFRRNASDAELQSFDVFFDLRLNKR